MIYRRGRVVVVRQVASDARRAGQAVVAIDVAVGTGARRHGVRSRQCEARAGVVEGGTQPG